MLMKADRLKTGLTQRDAISLAALVVVAALECNSLIQ